MLIVLLGSILTAQAAKNAVSAIKDDSIIKAEDQDWRVPIISYLKDPGRGAERNIRRMAFKYVLIDDELYRRLKCFLVLSAEYPFLHRDQDL